MLRTLLLLLGTTLIGHLPAQSVTRMDQYLTGTRISYFIGQCGEEVAEADGKLSFCDKDGNLGVVTHSLGLNGRGVLRMIPNYFNDSEVFVTREGISIRHSDGSWENVPAIASILTGSSGEIQNQATIETGVLDKNGVLYFTTFSRIRRVVNSYNLITKELRAVPVTETAGVNHLAYDAQNDVIYALASGFRNLDLHRIKDGRADLVSDLEVLSDLISVGVGTTKMEVRNDSLWFNTIQGLYALATDASGFKLYDATDTGRLPFDDVNDFEFAPDGTLWLAQSNRNSNGALVAYDRVTDTYAEYKTLSPNANNPAIFAQFEDLAVLNDGRISAVALNVFGIFDLDVRGADTIWTFIDRDSLAALGIPITYTPNKVENHAGRTYYLTNDFSTGNSTNNEVLIRNDDGSWDTRNDNRPTNISYWDVERFEYFIPSPLGGVYLYNRDDNNIGFVDTEGNLRSRKFQNVGGFVPSVDQEGRLVYTEATGQTPFYQRLDLPFSQPINGVRSGNTNTASYGNVVAFLERTTGIYTRTVNGSVVDRDTLPNPEDFTDFYHFAVDSEGKVWLAGQDRGGGMPIARFDPESRKIERFEPGFSIDNPRRVVPGPDGVMYFQGSRGVIMYDGNSFHAILSADDSRLSVVQDAIVDTEGRLWLLDVSGTVHGIENFATNPTFLTYALEEILPLAEFRTASAMTIDRDGAMWIEGQTSVWRVIDDITAGFYRPGGEANLLRGRVYVDANQNGTYDVGEGYPSQPVAAAVNGEVFLTTTDADGSYAVLLEAANTDYVITLPTVGRSFTVNKRQEAVGVTDTNADVAGPDFILAAKDYNSLYFQTANRSGVWGFDRDGFENAFTTAVTNLSLTKPFRELEIDFSYFNAQPGTDNQLPEVLEVELTRLTPTGVPYLIDHLRINPSTHRWSISGLSTTDYTSTTETPARSAISSVPDTVTVRIAIDRLEARETLVMRVKTARFAAQNNGTAIGYGPRRVDSEDLNPDNDPNLSNGPIIIYPGGPGLPPPGDPFRDANNPYVSPEDIYAPPPYVAPNQIYAPPPYVSPIRSSYDPNDKLVDGGLAEQPNDFPLDRDYLTYTINFENEGNFSAKDVWVIDTLAALLEPASVQLLSASHDVTMDFDLSDDSTTVVRFGFENIYLSDLDSLNDGYVRFAVVTAEDKVIGDVVDNRAAIYFDQNPAIITNVVRVRFIEVISSTELTPAPEVQLDVFPNPASERLQVRSAHRILNIEVLDQWGRRVGGAAAAAEVDLSHLPSGVYVLRVATDAGTGARKFVVH